MNAKEAMKAAFSGCGELPHWDVVLRDAMHILNTTKWGAPGDQNRIERLCGELRRRKFLVPETLTARQREALGALLFEAEAENEKRHQASVVAMIAARRVAAQGILSAPTSRSRRQRRPAPSSASPASAGR